MQTTTVGVDLAKNCFQVVEADAQYRLIERKRLTRLQFSRWIIDGCAAAWSAGTGQSRPAELRPAAMTTLYVRDQSGFREAEATDVLDRAHALLAQRYRTGSPVLTSPALTREFLRVHLGTYEHEVFGVLHLDSRHRLIAVRR